MTKIKLLTSRLEFVAYVTTPPMQPMPAIVMWGSRFFIKSIEQDYTYTEVFCYAVVNVDTGEQPVLSLRGCPFNYCDNPEGCTGQCRYTEHTPKSES